MPASTVFQAFSSFIEILEHVHNGTRPSSQRIMSQSASASINSTQPTHIPIPGTSRMPPANTSTPSTSDLITLLQVTCMLIVIIPLPIMLYNIARTELSTAGGPMPHFRAKFVLAAWMACFAAFLLSIYRDYAMDVLKVRPEVQRHVGYVTNLVFGLGCVEGAARWVCWMIEGVREEDREEWERDVRRGTLVERRGGADVFRRSIEAGVAREPRVYRALKDPAHVVDDI